MGKWTRRGFITAGVLAGGVLVVGVAVRPGHRAPTLSKHVAEQGESLLNAWVKITPDNQVTAIVPHCDMGQGAQTALAMMLAEELDASWDSISVMEAPAIDDYANQFIPRGYLTPGLADVPGIIEDSINGAYLSLSKAMHFQITGGSMSVRMTGTLGMQVAGAAAREMLVNEAAKRWELEASELRTQNNYIYHDSSGRSATYAEFAALAGLNKPPAKPKLKQRKDYQIIGTSVARLDLPAKVTGQASFAMDADLPGMKYAAIKASPVLGNTVKNMDGSKAKTMPGVIDVVTVDNFVAVVADGYWQAKQALNVVDVEFTRSGADELDQAAIDKRYRDALDAAVKGGKSKKDFVIGETQSALALSSSVFEAEYQVPFLAHATMEPMNATAWVRDGMCDLWVGSQNPLGKKYAAAEMLGIEADNVTVHNQFLGGGFGRRANPDVSNQAAMLSQKLNVPVKLIWSREEDMSHDFYRPACISRFKAGLDDNGLPLSWENLFVNKYDPKEATRIPYNIANQNVRYVEVPTHVRFGPWRSVDHTQHAFFIESFVDELAANAGKDGYQYRRDLLSHAPRHLAVLDAAAELGGWGRRLPEHRGQGIAIVESFGTIVAEVVEVDMSSGHAVVKHVACVADPGLAVNPDGFIAQMESGIVYGLTAALYGEISIDKGAVKQSNFHDYEMLRMNSAPQIDVKIINSGAVIGGAGEPGTPPIAPALVNAIYAATGKRVRQLPLKKYAREDFAA